jgi:hypothetical protein
LNLLNFKTQVMKNVWVVCASQNQDEITYAYVMAAASQTQARVTRAQMVPAAPRTQVYRS